MTRFTDRNSSVPGARAPRASECNELAVTQRLNRARSVEGNNDGTTSRTRDSGVGGVGNTCVSTESFNDIFMLEGQ